MLIHEFHSKLNLRHDRGSLFDALRRLRSMTSLKSADSMEGWMVWTDSTQDPTDDGGSFRLSLATA